MRRTGSLPRVLWALALGACGRVGFGDEPALRIAPELVIETECGAVSEPGALAIGNEGAQPVDILGADVDGGFALVAAPPAQVAAGDAIELLVRPPAAVIGTDRAGDVKRGTLVLHTSDGDLSVALSASVVGANIDLETDTGVPLTLTFSGAGCPAPITARIANTGTLPATVAVGFSQRFILTGFTSGMVTVQAGGDAPITVRPYTSSVCAASEDLTFTVTGSVCTATPFVLGGSFNITGSSSCSCG